MYNQSNYACDKTRGKYIEPSHNISRSLLNSFPVHLVRAVGNQRARLTLKSEHKQLMFLATFALGL